MSGARTPTALIEALFAALDDADGGEAVLALHAPSAPVLCEQGIRAAGEVSPSAYAAYHHACRQSGPLPQWSAPVLLHAGAASGPVWFTVQERRSGQARILGVGIEHGARGMRITWCVCVPAVRDWDEPFGRQQALAHVSWLGRGRPMLPRLLLDASEWRWHWPADASVQTLPEARFSCQLSGVCCRHDYEILLPAAVQALIDALPWSRLAPSLTGTQLPLRADGQRQLKAINERCRFLDAANRCLIHGHLGWQPFGPCASFPYTFAATPEGVVGALSPICPSVRRRVGAPSAECAADLSERVSMVGARHADAYRLAPGVEISWERFRDIERVLLECLATPAAPLRQRLRVGARVLGALADGSALDVPAWFAEAPAPITPELRTAVAGMLAKILDWDRAALRAVAAGVPEDLSQREAEDESIVVTVLRQSLYAKIYSYPYDLTTAFNFVIVLYLLTLCLQARTPSLSAALWQELGSLGVHGLLRNVLHAGLPEGFRAVLGLAAFGQWMLSA